MVCNKRKVFLLGTKSYAPASFASISNSFRGRVSKAKQVWRALHSKRTSCSVSYQYREQLSDHPYSNIHLPGSSVLTLLELKGGLC
jgi:hypothetical protein